MSAALAGHGVSTLLVDRGDFGGYTSQASSNMVWGGFKYLEGLELGLVWNLCKARNRMIAAYPTNVVPIEFVANLDVTSPHRPWFAYLGTLAYWAFGRFRTPRPHYLSRRALKARAPAVSTTNSRGGVVYNDAYLPENDSRFVFQFVLEASTAGATVLNHTEMAEPVRRDGRWYFKLTDRLGVGEIEGSATILVNATGPFSNRFNDKINIETAHTLALSKGIHLIVDRLTTPDQILVFYDDTGRLFYVLPMGRRSSIGTTDTRTDEPTTLVTDEDRDFLLEQINERLDLAEPLTAHDVISTRAGVRPLVVPSDAGDTSHEDWTKLSRKHVIEVDPGRSVITILGGKLTDCINVGEEVLDLVIELGVEAQSRSNGWYGEPVDSRARTVERCTEAGLAPATAERLWRRYGERTHRLLEIIAEDAAMADVVFDFDDLRRGEVVLMAETEMIETLEDLLRRRTMLALTHRRDELSEAPGLDECATLLFGSRGPAMAADYRATVSRR